jgi:RHS repeat-associated protein
VIKTQTRQVFQGNTNTVTETSSYDQAGRLKQVKHQVNSGTEVTLASMEYDEVGQLKQKSLHGAVGSGIQNLNYAYNIRGWLEKINNPDVNPSSTSTQKLNLGLYYNNVPSGLSANSQYNGNIAGLVWNTPLQNGALSPADKQGYGFTYDGLNRMTNSAYGEGSTFATNAGANNENLAYDKNGNILTLTRYLKGTGQIDNLTYTYKNSGASNMLDRVDDSVTGTNGFSELVKQANEYGYDGNGNLTSDANKGYNSILYNYMNLPRRVGTTNTYISYVYDAAGTKLAKVGTGGAYTYYAGSFVYNGSSLNYIMHREGMYLPGGNYEYYLKDHLGNTRLVVNTSGTGGTVVQQTDYYPFGMDIATYNGGLDNKYRYNGKEFQDDIINGKSLQWYDYGARFYDPMIGRWHTVDNKAEKFPNVTPYAYALNNPIVFLDPDGNDIVYFNTKGQEVSRTASATEFRTYVGSEGNYTEASMPCIIKGYESPVYQKYDYNIAAQTYIFNSLSADQRPKTPGGESFNGDLPSDLDPTLVKAMVIEETGAGTNDGANGQKGKSDIMQSNVTTSVVLI